MPRTSSRNPLRANSSSLGAGHTSRYSGSSPSNMMTIVVIGVSGHRRYLK